MKIKVLLPAVLFLILSCGTGAQAASLLINGGFETGDLTGWVVGGAASTNPAVFTNSGVVPAHSGFSALDLGPSGTTSDNHGYASQTVNLSDPGIYLLEFWHRVEDGGGPHTSTFRLDLNGTAIFSADLASNNTYQLYSYQFGASAGALTLTFTDTLVPDTGYETILDDVSLTTVSTGVPEPASMMLLAVGLLGLAAAKHRQNRWKGVQLSKAA